MSPASADVFKLLADPTRRALLDLLRSGEKNAQELAGHFRASQQAISLHLQVLRRARVVEVKNWVATVSIGSARNPLDKSSIGPPITSHFLIRSGTPGSPQMLPELMNPALRKNPKVIAEEENNNDRQRIGSPGRPRGSAPDCP